MLLSQNKTQLEPETEVKTVDSRTVVSGILVGRAGEVMETARRYYPREIAELEAKLAELIQSGKLKGPLTGEELYSFLRQTGFDFSLNTTIRVREGGRLKSLQEKLRSKE